MNSTVFGSLKSITGTISQVYQALNFAAASARAVTSLVSLIAQPPLPSARSMKAIMDSPSGIVHRPNASRIHFPSAIRSFESPFPSRGVGGLTLDLGTVGGG